MNFEISSNNQRAPQAGANANRAGSRNEAQSQPTNLWRQASSHSQAPNQEVTSIKRERSQSQAPAPKRAKTSEKSALDPTLKSIKHEIAQLCSDGTINVSGGDIVQETTTIDVENLTKRLVQNTFEIRSSSYAMTEIGIELPKLLNKIDKMENTKLKNDMKALASALESAVVMDLTGDSALNNESLEAFDTLDLDAFFGQ
jgi:hypothetical protein